MTTTQIKLLCTSLFVLTFTFIIPQAHADVSTYCNTYTDSSGNVTTVCDQLGSNYGREVMK